VAFCGCGFTKEEPLVKFRCLCCSQKIAVNPEGIGVVIACPTCGEQLIVPPRSDAEFPEVPAGLARAEIRGAVVPQLARLMMNRLFQAVWSQRQGLLQTQAAATAEIEALEQRVALVQAKLQRRLAYYEERVAGLEAELEQQIAANRALEQRCRQLEAPARPQPLGQRRPNLHAGLLLRA
jgi:DNA-directed RNA polymerase subunit RPC12/RpoP